LTNHYYVAHGHDRWQVKTNEGVAMKSNNQERSMEDAGSCGVCGHGLLPDERMNFKGRRASDIQKAMYALITQVQLHLLSIECMAAKLVEIDKDERGTIAA
jgi:hypothetical protein